MTRHAPLGATVVRWSVAAVAAALAGGLLARMLGVGEGSLGRWLDLPSATALHLVLFALAIVMIARGVPAARVTAAVAFAVPIVSSTLNAVAAGRTPWDRGQEVLGELGWTLTGQSAGLRVLLGLAAFATLRPGRLLGAVRAVALAIAMLGAAGSLWGHAFGGAGVAFVPLLVPMSALSAGATLAAGVGLTAVAPGRWPMATLFATDADRRLMAKLLPFVVVVPTLGPAVATLAAQAGVSAEVTGVVGPTITLAALLWFLGLVQRAHRRLVGEVEAHDAQLRQVLDRLPVAVMLRDADGVLLHLNPETDRFLRRLGVGVDAVGAGPSQLIQHLEVVDEDGRRPDPETLPAVSALRERRLHSATLGYALPDGGRAWYSARAAPVELGDGTTGVVVTLDDATERHEARRQVALAEGSLRRTFDQAPIGIGVHDEHGRLVQVNAALCDLLGTEEQVLLAEGLPWATGDGCEALPEALDRRAGAADRVVVERRLRHADGRELVVEAALAVVRDEHRPARSIVQVVDVTAKRALEDELRRAAIQDPLTGLSNRRALAERLDAARERRARGGGEVGLVYLDLDAFKAINDEFGHDVGDRVLRDTARRLLDATRETDTVCRLGGDEFVVLGTPIDGRAGLDELLGRLTAAPPGTCDIDGRVVTVGWSLGAVLLEPDEGLDVVLRRADAAMYRAKRARRRAEGRTPPRTPAPS